MAMSPESLVRAFDGSVPSPFLESTLRCLWSACKAAYDECQQQYPKQEARDLLPYVRRAKFQSQWRDVAERYPGLTAACELNSIGNSYHTRVSAGLVILTASAVDSPGALVRAAVFRETYAEDSQLHLFRKEEPPPDGARLYSILLYGVDPTSPEYPAFANIAFPSKDCRSYVHEFSLFAKYRDLLSELRSAVENAAKDGAWPTLRKDIRSEEKGA